MEPSLEKQEQLVKQLISIALQGKHRPFEFILNRYMRKQVKIAIRAIKKFIKSLHCDLKRLNRNLNNFVGTAEQQKELIESSQAMGTVILFYKDEVAILRDMIKEYRCYFWQNSHLLATLLGQDRTEEELVDWRTLPFEF